MKQIMKRYQYGFTLIEVMVVVVILGILAAIVVPKVMDRPDMARMIKAKQDIRAIESMLNLYKLDHYKFPDNDQGLQALVSPPKSESTGKSSPYINKIPKDPWGNEYQYLNPGVHGEVDIFTLGADKQPGGEGSNKDIGSWNLE